jgi:uncharacterized membrane protein
MFLQMYNRIFLMRKAVIISIILIVFQFIAAFLLYPSMPDRIAIHWNVHGEADGYGSKLVGLFLIPLIEAFLIPVFLILPRIDPKADPDKLMGAYSWFILIFTFYMMYVYGLSIAWNLGYKYDFLRLLAPMLGILFIGIGEIIGKVEMNWFMGIRTPWTLSSQEVWENTHRLGGRLFKISGVLAFLGILFSGWISLLFVILPVMASSLILYSYLQFRKIKKK